MAFWNRGGALLPWPLNNNNANNANNNMIGAAAGAPPLGPPIPAAAAPAPINPMARAAAAAGARVRRGVRGVVARGWAPGQARRQMSETSTAREQDEVGEGLRVHVGEEVADRFARLKSNQHLAPRVKRTGPINLTRPAVLSDKREAVEKELLDRFVSCMEKAVGDGVQGEATVHAEAKLLEDLRAWMERVRQEQEQCAETRAFLVARRAELAQKEASLTAACGYIEAATATMTLPPAPKWYKRFN